MDKFIINGNRELAGEIEVRGSKNAAGPCLVASLLTEEDCVIDNLPLIEDINVTLEFVKKLELGPYLVEVKDINIRKLEDNSTEDKNIFNQVDVNISIEAITK